MPVDAGIVGMPLRERRVHVSVRAALAFAAAIEEDSLCCVDDMRADFMAAPTFCVRPEWAVVSANRAAGLGVSPEERTRVVHAGQSSRFIRPVKPATTVKVSGRIVAVRETRAGALVQTSLVIANCETDEPLSETMTSALYRGVGVAGAPRAMPGIVAESPGWNCPKHIRRVDLQLDRLFAHRYTECADIWNPIHTERRAALAAGLPDTIVHGTALWALAGRELVKAYVPGRPEHLRALSGTFSAMVVAGDPIAILHGQCGRDGKVAFTVLNANGAEAISKGVAAFG